MKSKIEKTLNLVVGIIWISKGTNTDIGWVWQSFLLLLGGLWLYFKYVKNK